MTPLLLALALTGATFQEAKEVFDAGQQAFEANQYGAAALAFEQALEMIPGPGPRGDPRPAIVFSMAQAYRKLYFAELDTDKRNLRALDRAVEAYRRYIVMDPNGSRRGDAEAHLVTLELELARVSLLGLRRKEADESRPTRIMITSKTPGALASIDGTKSSTVPLVREVEPGRHTVKVTAEGFFEQEVVAESVKGSLAVVPVNLEEMPAVLTVTAPNDAIISIDGRIVGVAPLGRSVKLSPGKRLLTVTRSGKQSFSKELELIRGVNQRLDVRLESTGQRQAAEYFLIGGGVIAAAAIVTGIVALLANAAARIYLIRRDVNQELLTAQDLNDYRTARNRYVDFRSFSVTSFFVSGIVLGTGAALWIFDSPSTPSAQGVDVAPLNMPTGGGLKASLEF